MFRWSKSDVQGRAREVQKILQRYFPNPDIPLHHNDPFTLLVAVILSAQCTDKRVNEVTPELFKVAGTPAKMAALPQGKLEALIRTCGLAKTKARNLIAAAKQILARHGGQVPSTRAGLEALPGVGTKTASVLLIHAFNTPAFPVDTHIFRSARRWGLSRGKNPTAVAADLCALYPPKFWTKLHLQFIYYARGYCTARGCVGPFGFPRTKRCDLCEKLARSVL